MSKNFVFFLLCFLIGCSTNFVRTQTCSQNDIPTNENTPNSVQNDFGQPIFWDQHMFPIRVVVDLHMREERKIKVQQAINSWNNTTGLEVFSYEEGSQTSEDGTVWIAEEFLPTNECGGQFYGLARRFFRYDFFGLQSAIVHGTIKIHTLTPDDRVTNTIIHELGHALGLHHDNDINSIMYPYNNDRRGQISEEDKNYVITMVAGPRPSEFINFNIPL